MGKKNCTMQENNSEPRTKFAQNMWGHTFDLKKGTKSDCPCNDYTKNLELFYTS